MLSRKLLLGLAPLLAVIALSVVPAMAQALEWLVGGKPITAATAVESSGGPFVLKTAKGGQITCTTLADHGEIFPTTPPTGLVFLLFTGCSSALCPGTLTIEEEIHVELLVITATEIHIDLLAPIGVFCNGTSIGEVKETTLGNGIKGEINKDALIFEESGNLTFRGEASTITGEDVQLSNGEEVTVM